MSISFMYVWWCAIEIYIPFDCIGVAEAMYNYKKCLASIFKLVVASMLAWILFKCARRKRVLLSQCMEMILSVCVNCLMLVVLSSQLLLYTNIIHYLRPDLYFHTYISTTVMELNVWDIRRSSSNFSEYGHKKHIQFSPMEINKYDFFVALTKRQKESDSETIALEREKNWSNKILVDYRKKVVNLVILMLYIRVYVIFITFRKYSYIQLLKCLRNKLHLLGIDMCLYLSDADIFQ